MCKFCGEDDCTLTKLEWQAEQEFMEKFEREHRA